MVELVTAFSQSAGRARPLLGMIGDSRLANGKVISSSDLFRYMHGVGSWVGVLTKGNVSAPLSYNKAVVGSTLNSYVGDGNASARGIIPADGSAGQLSDLLAMSPLPSHALILDGTNDIGFCMSLASMKSLIQTVWSRLQSAGIVPVMLLDLPRGWTVTASRNQHFAYNTWLQINAPKYGAVIIDATPVLEDIASSTGDPLSSLYYDSPAIHPNNLGAYNAGLRVANYFNALSLAMPFHGFSQGDVYDATNNPGGNLMPKGGVCSGSGGTLVGTNVSGTVCDGMQVNLFSGSVTSCVCAVSTRADGGAGNWQTMTITTAGAAQIWFYPSSDITIAGATIAVGDALEFGFDFDATTPANVSGITGRLIDNNVNAGLATYYGMAFDVTKGALPTAFVGRVEMDALTLLASTTRVLPVVSISISGAVTGAVLKVGGLSLRKPQA